MKKINEKLSVEIGEKVVILVLDAKYTNAMGTAPVEAYLTKETILKLAELVKKTKK